jgi:23S rRNA pseudouridine955/2504/2580 synthase
MAIKINRVKIKPDDEQIRVDRWFARHYPNISFTVIAKLARTGQIRLDGKRVKPSSRVEAEQELRFPELSALPQTPREANKTPKSQKWLDIIEDNIIYMDKNILAINKPAGLAVQGGTKVAVSLDDLLPFLKYEADDKPKLVHRLDKETSGVLILARTSKAAVKLSEIFRTRKMDKTYLAVLSGVPNPMSGVIDVPLEKEVEEGFESVRPNQKGKKALTDYRVIDYASGVASLVELKLITGKTHQLRVHCSHIGCPIMGDEKYNTKDENYDLAPRLYLHSYLTRVNYDGTFLEFKAPIPDYFKDALRTFGLAIR